MWWPAYLGAALVLVLLLARLIAPDAKGATKRPAFEAFEDRVCERCAAAPAERFSPQYVEIRTAAESVFAWLLPLGLVPARYRVNDDVRGQPTLCRLDYAHDRAKLERHLADEQAQLAAYLEGRALRLHKYQAGLRAPLGAAPTRRRLAAPAKDPT